MARSPAPRSSTGVAAPAENGNGAFLSEVRSLLAGLPPAEKRVGHVAVSDPAGTAAMTISQLARLCDTSETTIVRFCRAIGLRGYPELRIALASAAGRAAQNGTAPSVGGDIGPGDTLAQIVQKIGYTDSHAVEDTVRQLDRAALQRVIDAITDSTAIDLYGIGASALVAMDLEQKFHRIGYRVHAWPDPHAALTSAALLHAGTVAIGFSHTGETMHTVAALRQARQSGATTVAITNSPRSSIAGAADLLLTTATGETTFRSGAMASRIAALTVVDCVFVGVAQRRYAETLQALERTRVAVETVYRRRGTASLKSRPRSRG